MKNFYCQCGQPVFFDNSACIRCGTVLGYAFKEAKMMSLEAVSDGEWRDTVQNGLYRLCANRIQYNVCNGVVSSEGDDVYCVACRLNHTIPDLSETDNLQRWQKIEQAKRRLIYGLVSLGLPLEMSVAGYPQGMMFSFLEDQRSNPNMSETFVMTGHHQGMITLNVMEADDVARTAQREQSAERYRTVLGHFRHEVGHYYYELLSVNQHGFEVLFGDPLQPYDKALKRYYDEGPPEGWANDYISAYASMHPLEDWAECFAHYLHAHDVVETAVAHNVIEPLKEEGTIEPLLGCWDALVVTINEINNSLGLRDTYPFLVTQKTADKLRFVDEVVRHQTCGGDWKD